MIRFVIPAAVALFAALPLRAEIAIQEVTSPGGITAWLVEEHSIPFTALQIRFKGGQSLDRDGKRGAVNLMTGLIEEGAGDLDAQGFAAARERLAASYGFDSYNDGFSVSAQFLTENRAEAVELLRSALIEPRFDQDAIDRVRDQVLSNIRSDAQDPGELGQAALRGRIFGDHPYGSDGSGTIESVNALTRDDIVQAWKDVLVKERLYVAAVGDITPDALGTLLDDLLGGLPETGAALPGRAPYDLEAGVTVVPFDTPQSVILFGHEGITRDDPDFFAAYVVNQIFGGGNFSSRLMTEVREKRGLTYGIGTYLAPYEHAELIMGQAATANARAAETVQVVRDEWARIANEGITAQELEDAKTYLTGAYPLRFDGNSTIASQMVGMQMEDLPIDYIATRNDKVNAVTLEEANRVAKRIYRPEDLHFVVVGQPDGLVGTAAQ
ncbi:M16 family metallopeptidase [Oceaniglobus indicus]|uniref:M16 family metallopeptidase n=1 Tax=Oceaniglobus indicus TaxID=2047749 RepID=UPI000C192167|nr:pitrilysin family protein [Oceaniglobus indicus]